MKIPQPPWSRTRSPARSFRERPPRLGRSRCFWTRTGRQRIRDGCGMIGMEVGADPTMKSVKT
eukprot:34497-Rhodomonas_salina.4